MKRSIFILLAAILLAVGGCARGGAEPAQNTATAAVSPSPSPTPAQVTASPAPGTPAPTPTPPPETPSGRTNFLLTDSEPVRYLIVPYVDDGALPTRYELDETERAELWSMLCDLVPIEEVPRLDDEELAYEELAYHISYVSDEQKHDVNIWPDGIAQFGAGSAAYVCDGLDYDLLAEICGRKFSIIYAPDDPEKAAESFKTYFNEVAESPSLLTELWFDPDISNGILPFYCHDSMINRCKDEHNVLALCFSYHCTGESGRYAQPYTGFLNSPQDRPVVAFMERESENDDWHFALWSDIPLKHLVSSCDKQMFID